MNFEGKHIQFFSQKYCGDVELPVPRSKNGVMSFDFPFTPLARRIYNEEEVIN